MSGVEPNYEPTEEKKKIEKALTEKGYLPRTRYFIGGLCVGLAFPEEKIAIEIDDESDITDQQKTAIEKRDLQLQEMGWKVFRYSKGEVNKDHLKIALKIIHNISVARGEIELHEEDIHPIKPSISINQRVTIKSIDNVLLATIISISISAFGVAYILIRGILDLGSFLVGCGLIAAELTVLDILFGEKHKTG